MNDEDYMTAALQEAEQGRGTTGSNPMVGAVIVEDGQITARGYHERPGELHAEINALNHLGRPPKPGAKMYVTLEPCSTVGRTGACTKAIIKSGLSEVIIGSIDPNPDHKGRGVKTLEEAGISVVLYVFEDRCSQLNEEFNERMYKLHMEREMKHFETKDSIEDHKEKSSKQGPTTIAIVTVSDSRSKDTDVNAQFLMRQIEESGHDLIKYHLIKDESVEVARILDELVEINVQVILFNGGTGISKRDTTFDVISQKLEKELPGFGEIFRMLSYEEIGPAAILSRATAGVYKNKIIISTPGSPKAVQLAWKKLILPELYHLAWEVGR